MHFGRIKPQDASSVELPELTERSRRFLALPLDGRQELWVGPPIWASADWIGSLYPEGTRPSQYLRLYAEHYRSVELNSSFYRVPSPEQAQAWRREVGPDFLFCPKVPKSISHQMDQPDLEALQQFLQLEDAFEDNLGLSFLQLPEWFALKDYPLLDKFLSEHWPAGRPLALEFRHASWFQGSALLDPLINRLYKQQLSVVVTDTPGQREVLHSSLCSRELIVRFLGNFPSKQDDERIRQWASRIDRLCAGGMDRVYFFVHQERNGAIPATVDFALRCFAEKSHIHLKRGSGPRS